MGWEFPFRKYKSPTSIVPRALFPSKVGRRQNDKMEKKEQPQSRQNGIRAETSFGDDFADISPTFSIEI